MRAMYGSNPDALRKYMPNLTQFITLPGVGHWTQQEAPEAVHKALIQFLDAL